MFHFLLPVLIHFAWDAPVGGGPVESYKLCVGDKSLECDRTVLSTATDVSVDLDVSKVWYAHVKAVNQFGESPPSNEVIVGKPHAPKGLVGRP